MTRVTEELMRITPPTRAGVKGSLNTRIPTKTAVSGSMTPRTDVRVEPMRWTASTRVRLESTAVITASRAAIMNSHHEDRGWKVPVPTALANANAAPKNST